MDENYNKLKCSDVKWNIYTFQIILVGVVTVINSLRKFNPSAFLCLHSSLYNNFCWYLSLTHKYSCLYIPVCTTLSVDTTLTTGRNESYVLTFEVLWGWQWKEGTSSQGLWLLEIIISSFLPVFSIAFVSTGTWWGHKKMDRKYLKITEYRNTIMSRGLYWSK